MKYQDYTQYQLALNRYFRFVRRYGERAIPDRLVPYFVFPSTTPNHKGGR